MKRSIITKNTTTTWILLGMAFLLFQLSGCAGMDFGGQPEEETASSTAAISENEPYFPTDYPDLLIPGELSRDMNESLTINTATYNGGILNFKGRVEVDSLTNFFITTMQRNNWVLAGSIKSKDVMIAFTKENSSCIIRIIAGDYAMKTNVYIYIAKNV